MSQPPCCRECVDRVGSFESPLSRMVATGWYDGVTDGVAECARCGTLYAFSMLDAGDGEDLRIFALAPTSGSLAEFDALEPIAAVRPVTVLFGDARQGAKADFVDRCIAHAGPAQFVVASFCLDESIELWRCFPTTPPADWFASLGLSRSSQDA